MLNTLMSAMAVLVAGAAAWGCGLEAIRPLSVCPMYRQQEWLRDAERRKVRSRSRLLRMCQWCPSRRQSRIPVLRSSPTMVASTATGHRAGVDAPEGGGVDTSIPPVLNACVSHESGSSTSARNRHGRLDHCHEAATEILLLRIVSREWQVYGAAHASLTVRGLAYALTCRAFRENRESGLTADECGRTLRSTWPNRTHGVASSSLARPLALSDK